MFIKIKNEGLIAKEAFTLIGASTKRDDSNKIGFFGSGLKYSLAVLLRNQTNFKIYSGLEEIVIDTKQTVFRDKIFNQIIIDGRETGFTKEMGIDWKAWFPIRELYCNAIDEQGGGIEYCESMKPVEGETHFYIEINDDIKEILENWNDYFSNKREDVCLSSKGFKAYNGADKKFILYRRGVQCFTSTKKCLYHYDSDEFVINESRVLYTTADSYWKIAELVAKNADADMIRNIFDNYKHTTEGEDFWWHYNAHAFNDLWLEVINGRRLARELTAGHYASQIAKGNCLVLPNRLVEALKSKFGKEIKIVGQTEELGDFLIIDETKVQREKIEKALVFCSEGGIDIPYPIKVAVFDETNVWGSIHESSKTILLSVSVFDEGMKKVVETLIEEWGHIKSGARDESRSFQDFLINQLVTRMEEKQGIYL